MARGPKLFMLIITAVVALVLLFNRGGNATLLQEELANIALRHLDGGYILYFRLDESLDASADVMKTFTAEYAALVENEFGGKVKHQYDTLVYGFSFDIEFTDKVYKAIGLKSVPLDTVKISHHFFDYLSHYRETEMKLHGVKISMERDNTVSTQGDVGGV